MARRLSDTLKNCLCCMGMCHCLDSDSSSGSILHQSQQSSIHTGTSSQHTPSHHSPSHHTPSHHASSPENAIVAPLHPSRSSDETISSNESVYAAAQQWNFDDGMAQDDPALSHLKYNKFQAAGQQRQKWIESSNEPGCPVALATLTFADLRRDLKFAEPAHRTLSRVLKNQVEQLGLPTDESAYYEFDHGSHSNVFSWIGHIGPGVISINEVFRLAASNTPRMAFVTNAIYEYKFPMESLKHVFVIDIINKNTAHFLKRRLYTEDNGLAWPKRHEDIRGFPPRIWEPGTAEYEGLLGTQCGKIISYLVLGAYPRGTRRIVRIVSRPIPPCLRFDIEDISI